MTPIPILETHASGNSVILRLKMRIGSLIDFTRLKIAETLELIKMYLAFSLNMKHS